LEGAEQSSEIRVGVDALQGLADSTSVAPRQASPPRVRTSIVSKGFKAATSMRATRKATLAKLASSVGGMANGAKAAKMKLWSESLRDLAK
jgi:hypothetical protein